MGLGTHEPQRFTDRRIRLRQPGAGLGRAASPRPNPGAAFIRKRVPMNPQIGLENCLSFINCQMQAPRSAPTKQPSGPPWRAITISRQSGSGGHSVAATLVALLRAQDPEAACPWTVFDRDLVQKV